MGIEPTYPAWKAGVLPLNYTRSYEIIKVHLPMRAIDGARTRGLDLGKVALYQLSYVRMCFWRCFLCLSTSHYYIELLEVCKFGVS